MRRILALGLIDLFVVAGVAHGQIVAYQVPTGVVGNQTNGANLSFGMDFNVNMPVQVTQLGAFDSGQDGLIAPILVAIYNRNTSSLASPVITFATGSGPSSGTLNGGSRFLDISPIALPAGFTGSIIVFGYGNGSSAESDGNSFGAATGGSTYPWTTNDGGGALSFVGSGRYSNGGSGITFPTNIDTGPVNRYAAGTFTYTVGVPEPSTMCFCALATALCVGLRRSRYGGPS